LTGLESAAAWEAARGKMNRKAKMERPDFMILF
jgi:hypothetical protein